MPRRRANRSAVSCHREGGAVSATRCNVRTRHHPVSNRISSIATPASHVITMTGNARESRPRAFSDPVCRARTPRFCESTRTADDVKTAEVADDWDAGASIDVAADDETRNAVATTDSGIRISAALANTYRTFDVACRSRYKPTAAPAAIAAPCQTKWRSVHPATSIHVSISDLDGDRSISGSGPVPQETPSSSTARAARVGRPTLRRRDRGDRARGDPGSDRATRWPCRYADVRTRVAGP